MLSLGVGSDSSDFTFGSVVFSPRLGRVAAGGPFGVVGITIAADIRALSVCGVRLSVISLPV